MDEQTFTRYPRGSLVRMKQIVFGDSVKGVPALLPIGERTFYTWLKNGTFPPGIKLGGNVRAWRIEDVVAFADKAAAQTDAGGTGHA